MGSAKELFIKFRKISCGISLQLVIVYRATWTTFGPRPSKFFLDKNFLYFFLKKTALKNFLIFREIELSSFKLKKLLTFSEMELSYIFSKKVFLIFRETKLFKKTFYISGGNFPSPKNKKTQPERISSISGNGTF